jgi:hypothetical protein
MNKKMMAILFFNFLSTLTYADINGNWSGFGYWSFDGGSVRCLMNISFLDNNNVIVREKGFFDCDFTAMELPELKLKKVGNNLVDENNKVVGKNSNNEISFIENYSDTVDVSTSIISHGTNLDYSETWYNKNKVEIYQIKGRFFQGK